MRPFAYDRADTISQLKNQSGRYLQQEGLETCPSATLQITYTNAIRAACQDIFVLDDRWWRKGYGARSHGSR